MAGRYKFLEELGQGGAGAVFKAYDTQLDRYVAIKRLFTKAEMEQSDSQSGGLRKEAGSLAALQHPNIVSIYDLGSDDEGFFMVMELVEGETLADWIANGPMNLQDFLELGSQTLEAVLAAHSQSLLHRDLKPENIKIQRLPGGRIQVKVLDFGLARLSYGARKMTEDQAGNIMGSIYYMSPEQFMRKPLDGRADLYALGCVYYQALCGHRPYSDETVQGIMSMHLEHRVHPLKTMAPHLPDPICDWVMWLINLEPEDRPANAQQALNSLRDLGNAGWFSDAPMAVAEAIPVAIAVDPGTGGPLRGTATQSMVRPPTGNVSQRLGGGVPKRTTGLQPRRPTAAIPAGSTLSNAPTVINRTAAPKKPDPDVYEPPTGVPKWVYPVAGLSLVALIWGLWPGGDETTVSVKPPGGGGAAAPAPVVAPAQPLPAPPADFLVPGSVLHYRAGEKTEALATAGPAKPGELVRVWRDLQSGAGLGSLETYSGKAQYAPTLLFEKPAGIKGTVNLLRFTAGQVMVDRMDKSNAVAKEYPFGAATASKGATIIMLVRPSISGKEVRCFRLQNQDGAAYINLRAYPNNEWRLGVKAGSVSKDTKIINRSTSLFSLVGMTWDASNHKAVINVRSEDGSKGRAELDTPKEGLAVLNELRIGDYPVDGGGTVAPEDHFSGDIVELVVWPFALGWEDRSGQEMKFMQHYFNNPGARY
jgi:hypothetical protein